MKNIKFRLIVLALIITTLSSFFLFRNVKKQSETLNNYSNGVYNLILGNLHNAMHEIAVDSLPKRQSHVALATAGVYMEEVVYLFNVAGIKYSSEEKRNYTFELTSFFQEYSILLKNWSRAIEANQTDYMPSDEDIENLKNDISLLSGLFSYGSDGSVQIKGKAAETMTSEELRDIIKEMADKSGLKELREISLRTLK